MHTVYILKCSDDSTYVGCTGNLEERLKRHNKGEVSYTKSRLPFEVVLTINFPEKYKAFEFKKYLKSGSGRAFMYKRFI
tara:strand:+ start:63118 stop:63354 length:237 start_codon:yes stop_codon:yes gene_type:complete